MKFRFWEGVFIVFCSQDCSSARSLVGSSDGARTRREHEGAAGHEHSSRVSRQWHKQGIRKYPSTLYTKRLGHAYAARGPLFAHTRIANSCGMHRIHSFLPLHPFDLPLSFSPLLYPRDILLAALKPPMLWSSSTSSLSYDSRCSIVLETHIFLFSSIFHVTRVRSTFILK